MAAVAVTRSILPAAMAAVVTISLPLVLDYKKIDIFLLLLFFLDFFCLSLMKIVNRSTLVILLLSLLVTLVIVF